MAEGNPALLSNILETRVDEKPDTVGIIFENGGLYPDELITYRKMLSNSIKLAIGLRELGFKKGDKLALVMRNHPEVLYSFIASTLTGIVAVPIDPRSRGDKLTYQLTDSDSRGVITTADLLPDVEAAIKGAPDVQKVILNLKPDADPGLKDTCVTVQEMLQGPEALSLPDRIDDPNLPFEIIYTSGVMGNPKGVQIKSSRTLMYVVLAKMVWKYTPEDIPYTGLSLTHGNAQAVTMMPALAVGIPAVIGQRFSKSRIWDICRKYGCTTFSLLGGMMAGIYNEPQKPDDADNPVKVVISAGTPLPIWEAFEKRFNAQILEWYGAVEGGFAFKPIGEGPIGSFGKPIEGVMEMQVVDENDNEVAGGASGELICRQAGTNAEVDYYGKPKASADKTRGGWLRTGDVVHRDEEGWLFFDYRKGTALRRSGDFIKPEYVEKVIGEHPDVSEVCVYGIPASSGAPGESDLVAAVTPFPGKVLDPASVFEAAVAGLERNAVPSYVQMVEEIPKSPSEKYLDRILKEQFSPEADNVYRLEDYAS